MVATLIISSITFVALILSILLFPSIKIGKLSLHTYWLIALLGASVLLIFGLAPISNVWDSLTSKNPINPIKILVLFFSMIIISIILDELGLFKFLASVACKFSKSNQLVLFVIFYFLTATLTVFTSNDVIILTLTPFICFFAKRSKINPVPYLIGEFTAANTWSLMFVIGNPTNIYLATSSGISFVEYFKVMAVPTVVAGLTEFCLLLLIFHKQLKKSPENSSEIYNIEDKLPVIVGLIILTICLVFLVISSYIHVQMWLISLICASSLLVFMFTYSLFRKKTRKVVVCSLKRLPYQLVPFFLSMFVVVVALSQQGISNKLADFLGNKNVIWVYGYSSFLYCNLINNIPMSILFTDLASSLSGASYYQAIYASIIGSNIGAFLTPIGALAGIMFTGLVKTNDVRFGFVDFIKYGVIISVPVLSVCLGMCLLLI